MRLFKTYCAMGAMIVGALILAVPQAEAGLCSSCSGKMFVKDMGKCGGCGASTSSSAFQLCPACSGAKSQCEACLAGLSAAKPQGSPIVKPVVPPVAEPIHSPVVPPSVKKSPTVPAPAAK